MYFGCLQFAKLLWKTPVMECQVNFHFFLFRSSGHTSLYLPVSQKTGYSFISFTSDSPNLYRFLMVTLILIPC